MKAILTVIGKDQVGIVYEVSKILSRAKVNILDINQTIILCVFFGCANARKKAKHTTRDAPLLLWF